MTDTTTLQTVLTKTGRIIEGITKDQEGLPTPCPEFTVGRLRDHVVAWMRVFANGAAGDPQPGSPDDYSSKDPVGDFKAAAAKAIEAFERLSDDAPVTLSSGSMPAKASAAMMTGEYLAHGWDLATATGQPVVYTDEEAEAATTGLAPLLLPEYRGEGMPFGDVVEVPEDAPALDRFLGFAGRHPHQRR